MSATEATIRPATPQDWARAEARGIADNLQVFNIGGDPSKWFVTSASVNGGGYMVEVTQWGTRPWAMCGCQGAQRVEACKHKALVFARLGMLPTQAPTTQPVAIPSRINVNA